MSARGAVSICAGVRSLLLGAPCAALPCRCCLLLSGALAAMLMKGSRRLHRRGPGTGAASVGSRWRRQRWGPGGCNVRSSRFLDGSPTVIACEGNKNWEVIQPKRHILNLYSKVSAAVLYGIVVEACISTTVHRLFIGTTAVDIEISTTVVPMNRYRWTINNGSV
jgi:hypothetical protein